MSEAESNINKQKLEYMRIITPSSHNTQLVEFQFVPDMDSNPDNILNFTRSDTQPIEQNIQVSRFQQLREHPILQTQNLCINSANFNTISRKPRLSHECDDSLISSHSDDNGSMGQNLFATFLRSPTREFNLNEETSSEAGTSSDARIDAASPIPGTRASIAEPLLEMGFSMKHVKKAIDATGKLNQIFETLFLVIRVIY